MQLSPVPRMAAVVIAISLAFVANAGAAPPKTFSQAKRYASLVYKDHRETFYCGCAYDARKRVDATSCGYRPRKNAVRGKRVEWEHVVPAEAFGGGRACWQKNACRTKRGKRYGGRKCCEHSDPVFRKMESDLHDIVPAVGELNADRSDFSFGIVPGEKREYGACDFEIDRKRDVVEPRPEIRGDIARIYFYMQATYGIPIGSRQQKLFDAWAREDPADDWEKTRAGRIRLVQP